MPSAVGIIADSYKPAAATGPPVTGYAGWWDAADTASITATGGAVTGWNNKGSASALNLTSKSGAGTITTGTRTLNGRNTLDFVPIAYLNSSAYVQAQPLTEFLVIKSDTGAGNQYAIGHSGSGNAAVLIYSGFWGLYDGAVLQGTAADSNPHVFSCLHQGATSQIWIDGVSNVTGNAGTVGYGAIVHVGDETGASWDGLIAEVVIYARALTTPERQSVETYLKTKWGTP